MNASETERTDICALETYALETYALETVERKFLLKLFNSDSGEAHISELKPNSRTSLAKCNRICESLSEQGLVDYDTEIARFTLSAPGRILLRLTTTSLPVTPDELKLLRACRGSMTLQKLGSCVPKEGRSQLVSSLVARKLLKVTKEAITEVRLTEKGIAAMNVDYDEKLKLRSA